MKEDTIMAKDTENTSTQEQTVAADKDAEIELLKKQLAELEKKNAKEVKDLQEKNAAEVEALEKQLAEEREKNAAEAATPAEAEAPADRGNELVTVHLFKDGGKYKDDVFVAVNGESCQIRRGVDVQIKRKFAEVLARSAQQDSATAELIERESNAFAEQAKRLDI